MPFAVGDNMMSAALKFFGVSANLKPHLKGCANGGDGGGATALLRSQGVEPHQVLHRITRPTVSKGTTCAI